MTENGSGICRFENFVVILHDFSRSRKTAALTAHSTQTIIKIKYEEFC